VKAWKVEAFIKLFTGNATLDSAFAINALISFVCLLWTIGANIKNRDPIAWRGWIVFWIGTVSFYMLLAATDRWNNWSMPLFGTWWWIPYIGNDVATGSLLVSYDMTGGGLCAATPARGNRRNLWSAIVLVTIAVAADLVTHQCTLSSAAGPRTGWVQILTSVALARWAWRLRTRDLGKSMLLLVYALVQLPLQPMFDLMRISTGGTYESFVVTSFGVYAVLKLSLLGPIYLAVEKTPLCTSA
jgi:hypothetical protein